VLFAHGSLGKWVGGQRKLNKKGKLSSACKARLEALGFEWDPLNSHRETMLAELKRYKERFGHCNVPQGWRENPELGSWISNLRTARKNGGPSAELKAQLDELGFIWNTNEYLVEMMLAELKQFEERFGHCNVPDKWEENRRLASWMSKVRQRQKKGTLSVDLKDRLDELGFIWDTRDHRWETRYAELKHYKQRFGDCDVPFAWPENTKLANWVGHQRAFHKSGMLSCTRKKQLDALGFEWSRKS
jgi:hypothetical protein